VFVFRCCLWFVCDVTSIVHVVIRLLVLVSDCGMGVDCWIVVCEDRLFLLWVWWRFGGFGGLGVCVSR